MALRAGGGTHGGVEPERLGHLLADADGRMLGQVRSFAAKGVGITGQHHGFRVQSEGVVGPDEAFQQPFLI